MCIYVYTHKQVRASMQTNTEKERGRREGGRKGGAEPISFKELAQMTMRTGKSKITRLDRQPANSGRN